MKEGWVSIAVGTWEKKKKANTCLILVVGKEVLSLWGEKGSTKKEYTPRRKKKRDEPNLSSENSLARKKQVPSGKRAKRFKKGLMLKHQQSSFRERKEKTGGKKGSINNLPRNAYRHSRGKGLRSNMRRKGGNSAIPAREKKASLGYPGE